MDQQLRNSVWNSLWDAELAIRYWAEIGRRMDRTRKAIDLLSALTGTSAFAGFWLWSSYPLIWQTLIAITALLNLYKLTQGIQKTMVTVASLRCDWTQLRSEYSALWRDVDRCPEGTIRRRFEDLKKREIPLGKLEGELPCDKKRVKRRCEEQVKRLAFNMGRVSQSPSP